MVVSVAVHAQCLFQVVDRAVPAFVLTPQLPINDWVNQLDVWIDRSQRYSEGRPAIVDLSYVDLSKIEVWDLLTQLKIATCASSLLRV